MLHGESVLRQTPLQSYSVKAVPRTHVVSRSCFAQDAGSYKAYAVCTCNLTLTSRIYRHTDVAVPPSVRIVRMHVWEEATVKSPPSVKAVPRTHVVPRSCFAQDIGSYKAYAVCTCNLTLASRIYRNGGPPIGSQNRRGCCQTASLCNIGCVAILPFR